MKNNFVSPTKSCIYEPTQDQWARIVNGTEFMPNEIFKHIDINFINFKTSEVFLLNGRRIGFDCLSENEYVHVCNGGYYEDAPEIKKFNRI